MVREVGELFPWNGAALWSVGSLEAPEFIATTKPLRLAGRGPGGPLYLPQQPFVGSILNGFSGLDPDMDCFSTGQHVETDPRYGLTCATYVAAALKGAGIDILDIATWVPRPGDDAWSEWVLGLLEEHAPKRAEQLAGQKAPFRVRPDEMAAAASSDRYPVTMNEAADAASHVRKAVESLR